MKIEQDSGVVVLHGGFAIEPDCSRSEFLESEAGAQATSPYGGSAPWSHYQLSGGHIDNHDLIVGLRFKHEKLCTVDLAVSLYPPDQTGWNHYSVEIELETKRLHESILERLFGPASAGARGDGAARGDNSGLSGQEFLARKVAWLFSWGTVASIHDSKGGGTFIRVDYARDGSVGE